MADYSTLARPYAKAVFELARDGKTFAPWSQALAALAGLVSDPDVARLIGHPALTRGELAKTLTQALDGKLSAEAVALVRLLVENGRLKTLPAIAAQFEQLRAEAESRVDVEIVSAVEVPAAQRQQLADAVKKRLEREVAIRWSTDPDLIAGALIRAGDLVIDGSVRGELDRLQTALTR
ncbi:F0F1 ATP synthase subunit delta [Sinimarinibacterium thermocellulolyticum]|uniref:ATP synthase subunit delta n=1 Tax=Sinimarinibacterium thermocellulolyticum TaxID=3170016 RepID=A0ABV2A7B6_9GAMM